MMTMHAIIKGTVKKHSIIMKPF